MATEGTKLQVNFKTPDGSLINVYASDAADLEKQLTTIQDTASLIASVSASLGTTSAVATVTTIAGGTVISQPSQQVAQSASYGNNSCKHGARTQRNGVNAKTGKPWVGYFCPTPKGTPDQCDPVFTN